MTDRSEGRLAGLVAALRFARIPLVCAAFVAVASTQLQGRLIAVVIAVAVVAAGLALHAREIFHPTRPTAGRQPDHA